MAFQRNQQAADYINCKIHKRKGSDLGYGFRGNRPIADFYRDYCVWMKPLVHTPDDQLEYDHDSDDFNGSAGGCGAAAHQHEAKKQHLAEGRP